MTTSGKCEDARCEWLRFCFESAVVEGDNSIGVGVEANISRVNGFVETLGRLSTERCTKEFGVISDEAMNITVRNRE